MDKPIKIAIVDDEPNAIISIQLILEELCENYEIIFTANTVDQAWDLIKHDLPDLLFLDVDMPRGSGFDLLERFPIRKFDVVFVSAYAEYAAKAARYNVFAYLTKPVDVDLMKQTCDKYREFRSLGKAEPFRLK